MSKDDVQQEHAKTCKNCIKSLPSGSVRFTSPSGKAMCRDNSGFLHLCVALWLQNETRTYVMPHATIFMGGYSHCRRGCFSEGFWDLHSSESLRSWQSFSIPRHTRPSDALLRTGLSYLHHFESPAQSLARLKNLYRLFYHCCIIFRRRTSLHHIVFLRLLSQATASQPSHSSKASSVQ